MSKEKYREFDPLSMDLDTRALPSGEQKVITFTEDTNVYAWAFMKGGVKDDLPWLQLGHVVCWIVMLILGLSKGNSYVLPSIMTLIAASVVVDTCRKNFKDTGNILRSKGRRITVKVPEGLYSTLQIQPVQ